MLNSTKQHDFFFSAKLLLEKWYIVLILAFFFTTKLDCIFFIYLVTPHSFVVAVVL
jgi:hypothetical protein